ncbi:MAG: hypothetical protein V2B15_02375 [Bacteroidota bacterium]
MRLFPTLCLPLLINLLFISCSPAARVGQVEQAECSPPAKFKPLGDSSETLLFKSNISLFREHYSGLFLVKKMPDSSTHVVFLSELGLSLLDLRYKDDKFEVVSVQEFLNKPSILRTLKNDFRTLLLDLSAIGSFVLDETSKDGLPAESLEFRHRKEKYVYFNNEKKGTYQILRKKGIFKIVEFNMDRTNGLEIEIAHKRIQLHIILQQMNQLDGHADQ